MSQPRSDAFTHLRSFYLDPLFYWEWVGGLLSLIYLMGFLNFGSEGKKGVWFQKQCIARELCAFRMWKERTLVLAWVKAAQLFI